MIEQIKNILSLYLVIPAVATLGLYLTYKLKAVQFTKFPSACKQLFSPAQQGTKGKLSSFSAVAAVLGGNLGTGNIAGIAVALSMGGPGALFWMWIMALLGSIVKFVGVYLAVTYRKTHPDGKYVGGPMYYLRDGLGQKKLAFLFCVFTVLSACTVGNLVQVNSVALPLTMVGMSPLIVGILMAALVAAVLMGGAKYFAEVAAKVVPLMALLYLFSCLYILIGNYQQIIPTLQLIFVAAFKPTALFGGTVGFMIWDAIRSGFDRGLFATDAGVGLAPILHAEVDSDPYTQAKLGIVPPIIVMCICLVTGMVLLITGVAAADDLESTNLCIRAFEIGFGSIYAGHIVTFTLCLFAFTTILTWAYCAERAMQFISNDLGVKIFRIIFILLIPLGGLFTVKSVWTMADICLNMMLLINLTGVIGLSKSVKNQI